MMARTAASASSCVAADDDALARGQAVGLEDDRTAELARAPGSPGPCPPSSATLNRPVGMLCRSMNCLAKTLLPSSSAALLRRAEDAQAPLLELVDDAQGQRDLRADDGQVDLRPGAAKSASPAMSVSAIGTFSATSRVPPLPGRAVEPGRPGGSGRSSRPGRAPGRPSRRSGSSCQAPSLRRFSAKRAA